jgi:hypothetical protein
MPALMIGLFAQLDSAPMAALRRTRTEISDEHGTTGCSL